VASRRDVEVYLPTSDFRPTVEFDERDLNLYLRLAGVARFSHGTNPAPDKAPAIITAALAPPTCFFLIREILLPRWRV